MVEKHPFVLTAIGAVLLCGGCVSHRQPGADSGIWSFTQGKQSASAANQTNGAGAAQTSAKQVAKLPQHGPVHLMLRSSGKIAIGDKPVSRQALSELLRKTAKQSPSRVVVVMVSRGVNETQEVGLIELVKQAGLRHVQVWTPTTG